MSVVVFTMIAIVLIAAVVVGMVLVGIEGRGGDRAPEVSRQLGRVAKHLNGEAKPPKKFVRMVESGLSR